MGQFEGGRKVFQFEGGNKTFQDKNDIDFGWEYLVKLYNRLEEERNQSDKRISDDVRLSEKVIDPKRQLKMNEPLAKRASEMSSCYGRPNTGGPIKDELLLFAKERTLLACACLMLTKI